MKIIVPNRAFLAVTLLFAASAGPLCGQTVIGMSGVGGSSPMGMSSGPGYSSGWTTIAPLSSLASAIGKPGPLVQAGPIAIRPHLTYEVVRGTGILRIPGSTEKITMHTLSPGLLLQAGTRASAEYIISKIMYSSRMLEDATNHNFRLRGGLTHDKWQVGLSGSYGSNSRVLVETGGLTEEDTYLTDARIAYQLARRTEVELNLNHSVQSATPVEETLEWTNADWTLWSASTWLRFHVSKDFSAAVGVSTGYDEISDSPDMRHTQPQVQITWQPTRKISFSAEAGLERRRTRSNLAHIEENARYSTSLSYSPVPTTTLSASAGRSVEPSYFVGQTTQSDNWSVGLEQRLLTKLFLSVGFARRTAAYESTTIDAFPGRDDRYDSFSVRLSTTVLRKGSVAVFYQRARNRSNEEIFGFNSDQIGGQASYRF